MFPRARDVGTSGVSTLRGASGEGSFLSGDVEGVELRYEDGFKMLDESFSEFLQGRNVVRGGSAPAPRRQPDSRDPGRVAFAGHPDDLIDFTEAVVAMADVAVAFGANCHVSGPLHVGQDGKTRVIDAAAPAGTSQ